MYILGLMFAPFAAISPDADNVNKTYLSTIEAGMKSDKYPSGLRKQFEIQIERIQKKLPSIEYCIFPGVSTPGRMQLLLHLPENVADIFLQSHARAGKEIRDSYASHESSFLSWVGCECMRFMSK